MSGTALGYDMMVGAKSRAPALRNWLLGLSVPALLVGVLLFPDIHAATMGTGLAALCVIAGATALLLARPPRLLIVVALGAGFLPSATGSILACAGVLLLLVMFQGVRRAATPLAASDLLLLLVLIWAVFSWLMNLGTQADLWCLPVALLLFWTPWLIVFLLRASPWSAREWAQVGAAWIGFILVQLVPGLVKPLVLGFPGAYQVPLLPLEFVVGPIPGHDAMLMAADITSGTMLNAHHLGVVALLGVVYYLALFWRRSRRRTFGALLAVGFLLLMTDAKHVVLAGAVVGVPVALALLRPELPRRLRAVIFALALAAAIGGITFLASQVSQLRKTGLWQIGVELLAATPKVKLITRTAELLQPDELHTWIGYGPGAFGSRAASSRASGTLFKDQTQLPSFIPPYTSPAYEGAVYDLYTAEIRESIHTRSAILTSPFSSLVGLVAEYGVIGVLLFGGFLMSLVRTGVRAWRDPAREPSARAFGAVLAFAVPLFVVLSVFDTYFEQPDLVMPLATLWLLASQRA